MNTGYHMRACCAEIPGVLKFERNEFGNQTSMKGISVEMLDWMASALNLTYECVNTPLLGRLVTGVENTTFHYMTNDVCDVLVGPVAFRHSRFQVVDYLHPWVSEPAKLLIPMPVFVSDSSAFWKPFTFPVWMVLLVSLLAMITTLMLMDYLKGPPGSSNPKLRLHWLFVIGSVFGQGGFWASKKNTVRILMVTWLLSAFILSGFYTSQLFGYIMTSIPVPAADSAEELANKPGVDLVVVERWAPEVTIMTLKNPLMKKLAKKLEKNATASRCATVADCVERVKKNMRPTAFIHQIGPMSLGIMEDFRRTGQCNFAIAKKSFDNYHQSWMIRKGDRNTEFYNRETMRMHEAGLLNRWLDIYQPKPHKCLDMAKPKNDPRNPDKISLKNLAIPFGMLIVGLILSLTVLIFEKWLAFIFKRFRAAVVV